MKVSRLIRLLNAVQQDRGGDVDVVIRVTEVSRGYTEYYRADASGLEFSDTNLDIVTVTGDSWTSDTEVA